MRKSRSYCHCCKKEEAFAHERNETNFAGELGKISGQGFISGRKDVVIGCMSRSLDRHLGMIGS